MNHIMFLLILSNHNNENAYFAKSVRKIKYLYPAQKHIYVINLKKIRISVFNKSDRCIYYIFDLILVGFQIRTE